MATTNSTGKVKTRKWFHLSHDEDKVMFERASSLYKTISEEEKVSLMNNLTVDPKVNGGLLGLKTHKVWVELLVEDYVKRQDTFEIKRPPWSEIEKIIAVWFFDTWIKSRFFDLPDYKVTIPPN